jgi:hypothetical protein
MHLPLIYPSLEPTLSHFMRYLPLTKDCSNVSFSLYRDKSAAEKRRQLIQESKFLGGDMEHTHLVKGLDFALLQKVSPGDQVGSNNRVLSALVCIFVK